MPERGNDKARRSIELRSVAAWGCIVVSNLLLWAVCVTVLLFVGRCVRSW